MDDVMELLGVNPRKVAEFREGIDATLNTFLSKTISRLDTRPSAGRFGMLQTQCLVITLGAHLHWIDTEKARSTASQGVEYAKKYFFERWFDAVSEKDAGIEVKKSPKNKKLNWSCVFHEALLLAFLLDDLDAVQQLSSWPEGWMRLDLSDEDPLWGVVLTSIAAGFRDSPMIGIDESEEAALKGRGKGPKLCLQAWIAGRSGDSAAFEKHLIKALQHFEKTATDPIWAQDVIALYPSLVLAAARCKGMKMPDLEPRLLARLLTPESVGFAQ